MLLSESLCYSSLSSVLFVSGSGHLYEDDGVTEGYKSTDFTNTSFGYKHDTSK